MRGDDIPFTERNSNIQIHSNRSPTPRLSNVHRAFPSLHINQNKQEIPKKWPMMHFNTSSKESNNNSILSASENTESGYTLPQALPSFTKSSNKDMHIEQPKPYFASDFPITISNSNQSASTGFSQSSGFHYNIPGYDDTWTVTAPSGYQFINQPSKKKHRSQNKTDDKKHSRHESHERSHKSRSNGSEEGSRRKRRSEVNESDSAPRSKREFDQGDRNNRGPRGRDRNPKNFVKGENRENRRNHNNDRSDNSEQGSSGNNFNSFLNHVNTFGNNFNASNNNNFMSRDIPIVPVSFED